MTPVDLASPAVAGIDLNQPGTYLTWNVFTISVANLVLIAVMVVIFAAALLIPFPGARHETAAAKSPAAGAPASVGTAPVRAPMPSGNA